MRRAIPPAGPSQPPKPQGRHRRVQSWHELEEAQRRALGFGAVLDPHTSPTIAAHEQNLIEQRRQGYDLKPSINVPVSAEEAAASQAALAKEEQASFKRPELLKGDTLAKLAKKSGLGAAGSALRQENAQAVVDEGAEQIEALVYQRGVLNKTKSLADLEAQANAITSAGRVKSVADVEYALADRKLLDKEFHAYHDMRAHHRPIVTQSAPTSPRTDRAENTQQSSEPSMPSSVGISQKTSATRTNSSQSNSVRSRAGAPGLPPAPPSAIQQRAASVQHQYHVLHRNQRSNSAVRPPQTPPRQEQPQTTSQPPSPRGGYYGIFSRRGSFTPSDVASFSVSMHSSRVSPADLPAATPMDATSLPLPLQRPTQRQAPQTGHAPDEFTPVMPFATSCTPSK